MGFGNRNDHDRGAFANSGKLAQSAADRIPTRSMLAGAMLTNPQTWLWGIAGVVLAGSALYTCGRAAVEGVGMAGSGEQVEATLPVRANASIEDASTGATGNDGVTEEPNLEDVLGNATGQLGGGEVAPPSGATVPDALGSVTEPQTFVSENETGVWGAIRQECGSVSDAGIGLIIEASGLTNDYMIPPNTPTVLECGAAAGN